MGEVFWKDLPGLAGRSAPVVIDSIEQIQSLPFVRDLEKVMNEYPIEGMFCVQEVPQIVFMKQDTDDTDEIRGVQRALWNQGLARILVVQSPDLIRVFSTAKTVITKNKREFTDQLEIKQINTVSALDSFEQLVLSVESGRYWEDNAEYFDPKESIDQVLLDNLVISHRNLIDQKLSPSQAQAALIQSMFIAYLEDRRFIDAIYVRENTSGGYDEFISILSHGDAAAFRELFFSLKRDFNGDLFVAPCSFTSESEHVKLTPKILDILAKFRCGSVEMHTGQTRFSFYSYDFNYIPIALISEVYDSFMNRTSDIQIQDNQSRQKNINQSPKAVGAFYTPLFLVDTVVSHIWKDISSENKKHGVFLDPACGSGVFLVRCFQRLCQYLDVKSDKSSWQTIQSIIDRIKGVDVDEIAVRVAVFSLYLAMFEMESSANFAQMLKNRPKLPKLLNKTIHCANYFSVQGKSAKADVIFGNPPWSGNESAIEMGREWCESKDLPFPRNQLAWAFIWKARDDIRTNGKVAFLLPAGGVLHSTAEASFEARKLLFASSYVRSVINFSDLRMQLFKNSRHPASLVVFDDIQQKIRADYQFEYWTPKSDLNNRIKRFIVLNSVDKKHLSQSNVISQPAIFAQKFWMTFPESRLFSYLSVFAKLSKLIKRYNSASDSLNESSTGWVIGQGYKQRFQDPNQTRKLLENLTDFGELKQLDRNFSPLAIANEDLTLKKSIEVSSEGFIRAYGNPRILIARTVEADRKRLTASYSEEPLVFPEYTRGICFPTDQKKHAKFLTAVLNSKLVVWFLFHNSAAMASARNTIPRSELLKFPVPEPEDFPVEIVDEKYEQQNKLAGIVDLHLKNSNQSSEMLDQRTFEKIDSLTYDYYGLSDSEIVLVEDTVDRLIDITQPSQSKISKSSYFGNSDKSMREKYADQLAKSLEKGMKSKSDRVSVKLIAHNKDYGLLKIACGNAASYTPYSEPKGKFVSQLRSIPKLFEKICDSNFQTIPDFRIFEGDYIYVVKPMQQRFWYQSAAIDDAGKIKGDVRDFALQQFKEQ